MSKVHGSKKLGALMQNWHSSMGDPIYGVGSHFFGGHPVELEQAERALDAFESIHARRKAIKLPLAAVRELNVIIFDLKARIRTAAAVPNPGKKRPQGARDNPTRKPIDHKFAGQLLSADRQLGVAYIKGTVTKGTARDLLAGKRKKSRSAR